MGDIDFDELDKAVNSLMSSNDAPMRNKTSGTNSKPNVTSTSFGASRLSMPARQALSRPEASAPKPDMQQSSLPRSVSPVQSAPAVRRSGRFMDVVDSSSELNPLKRPSSAATSRPSQSKSTIKPLNEVVVPPVEVKPEPAAVAPSILESDAASKPGESVMVRRVPKDAPMPDPLEMLQPKMESDTAEEKSSEDEARPVAVFGQAVNDSPAPISEPGQTPIMVRTNSSNSDDLFGVSKAIQEQIDHLRSANTKADTPADEENNMPLEEVAFKPAFEDKSDSLAHLSEPQIESEAAQSNEPPEEVSTPATPPSDSPFLTDAKPEKRPLNAQITDTSDQADYAESNDLPSDAVADSEAETKYNHEQEPDTQAPELSSELVAIEATGRSNEENDDKNELLEAGSSDHTPLAASETTVGITGPTSITQQYQSKESTSDTSHAPIYDATQYPDPIAHPAKKKSGWWLVLGIMLLLAVGSGGAVALYFMGIIP